MEDEAESGESEVENAPVEAPTLRPPFQASLEENRIASIFESVLDRDVDTHFSPITETDEFSEKWMSTTLLNFWVRSRNASAASPWAAHLIQDRVRRDPFPDKVVLFFDC
ncbi:hypothetical protein U1Q18_008561 [Sarracenia purpurea var. burkii]